MNIKDVIMGVESLKTTCDNVKFDCLFDVIDDRLEENGVPSAHFLRAIAALNMAAAEFRLCAEYLKEGEK